MSNQSQKHGFIWENEIRNIIFNKKEESNNTDKYDIITDTENISIKTTGSNTICCSDILRFFTYDFNKKNIG